MLQSIDAVFPERSIHCTIHDRIHRRNQQVIVLVTEPSDFPQQAKTVSNDLVDMNNLMLDRQHGQGIIEQVDTLVV